MPEVIDLLLRGAGQLLTCRGPSGELKRGEGLSDPGLVRGASIAVADGKVLAAGTDGEVSDALGGASIAREIDAGGRVVLPGWVDPHTHAVFSRYRADEYEARIRGDSYLEIERRGGGIKRTVREVREMDEEKLFEISRRRLLRMLEHGTTTVEIKSGYGLDLETELKMLRVIARLGDETPLDVVPTFMGAHQKPPGYADGAVYVKAVIDEMIPAVAKAGLARFIDVFCEEGVFDLGETRAILEAGRKHRFGLKIHADEITYLGGAELAAELGAISAEHLIRISKEGIRRLGNSDTVAVLLPGTSFGLASRTFAPARELIDAGAAVALATDFNPGSAPSSSMPLTISIACSQMRMTPAEAVNAATYNAAFAIGMNRELGSIEIGKKADIIVYDVEDYRELPSRAGLNHALMVIKKGKVVWEREGSRVRSEVGL